MKGIIGFIIGVVIFAVAVNFFIDGDAVSRAHFDERINAMQRELDSIKTDLRKVWNVSRETKANTDSIKAEVRGIENKIDVMQKDVTDIKETSHKIEFKLF